MMLITRNIAMFSLALALLSGCGKALGFPDIPASFSAESRDAPWPEFQPLDQIFLASAEDFILDDATIQSLRYRISRLRIRANALQGPVITARERLKMQNTLRRFTP